MVLHFWFLREGNVLFFSDMTLFMISTFVFSSWVSVCVVVFAVYWSLSFSVWLWLGLSCFPVFSVTFIVLGVSWFVSLYICWWISSISRVKKTNHSLILFNLVCQPLVCCLKSSGFCLNSHYSFSIPSFWRVALKIII